MRALLPERGGHTAGPDAGPAARAAHEDPEWACVAPWKTSRLVSHTARRTHAPVRPAGRPMRAARPRCNVTPRRLYTSVSADPCAKCARNDADAPRPCTVLEHLRADKGTSIGTVMEKSAQWRQSSGGGAMDSDATQSTPSYVSTRR